MHGGSRSPPRRARLPPRPVFTGACARGSGMPPAHGHCPWPVPAAAACTPPPRHQPARAARPPATPQPQPHLIPVPARQWRLLVLLPDRREARCCKGSIVAPASAASAEAGEGGKDGVRGGVGKGRGVGHRAWNLGRFPPVVHSRCSIQNPGERHAGRILHGNRHCRLPWPISSLRTASNPHAQTHTRTWICSRGKTPGPGSA